MFDRKLHDARFGQPVFLQGQKLRVERRGSISAPSLSVSVGVDAPVHGLGGNADLEPPSSSKRRTNENPGSRPGWDF